MSGTWTSGLFSCFDPLPTCCLATWCPCILYGKIQDRKELPLEPTSGFNGSCLGWYALSCCGLQCLLQMSSRREIRAKYNIAGSGSEDFLLAWCCFCCALIQEDKEIKTRERGQAGMVVNQQQYAPQQGGMTYAAPGGV